MKTLINFLGNIFILILLSKCTSCNFAPGSYPYAEKYEINMNESDLIKVIQDFKKNNPHYIMPAETHLSDGRKNEPGQNYWYHIYFYDQDENEIIKCWTRPHGSKKTTFAFVGINQGLDLGNWKMINKDFSILENRNEKIKFEERILNKIKDKAKVTD